MSDMRDVSGARDQDQADQAPGELELVRAFVNTLDMEERSDELGTPDQLRDWLSGRHLMGPGQELGEEELDRAVAVREALRSLLVDAGGEPDDRRSAPLGILNRESERIRPAIRFHDQGGSSIGLDGGSFDDAIARLLGIVHDAMRGGTWSRLKVCGSDTCRWAVFDHSKNRSRRWCSMAECGGRSKARAYWRRQRVRGSDPS